MRSFLLAVFLVSACASPDTTIDTTFDPCQPLALDSGDAPAGEHAGVDDAIALWRARGIDTVVDTPADGMAVVPVRFQKADAIFHGYYDDTEGAIYVNTDLDADPTARAIVIAHELGHAFGLTHVDPSERASLMNPNNLTVQPTDADAAAIAQIWGACTR